MYTVRKYFKMILALIEMGVRAGKKRNDNSRKDESKLQVIRGQIS